MSAVLLSPQRATPRAVLLSLALLFSGVAALAGDAPAPEPPRPRLRGLTPAQQDEARKAHDKTHSTWLESLSKEQQKAYWDKKREADGPPSRRLGARELPGAATYRWHEAAQRAGLSDGEIARLERDCLLIEDRQFKQVFQVYLGNPNPVFITSDSLLNAFHVLLEDSIRDVELRRVALLRQHLEAVVTQAREDFKESDFPVAKVAAGWRHAQLVVGPALRLLGTPPEFFDADARDEIERQVGKIRHAEVVDLPAWLGPPSRTLLALDYRRCRPVGIYSEAPLADYFRAVRWLQLVPFRADRDDELTAIGLLGFGLSRAYQTGADGFFSRFGVLLGPADDRCLPDAAHEFQNFLSKSPSEKTWNDTLLATRRWLLRDKIEHEAYRKLVDEMRLPPDAGEILPEIQFRVLPSFRLRDAVLFQQLAHSGAHPEGLAVAAMLGSDFARRHLRTDLAVFDAAAAAAKPPSEQERKSRRHPRSLYDDYLDALATLVAPPEPDAPPLLRGEAWAAKSCQTALAGWTQMRHTFTLQSKLTVHYFGLVDTPPGFVEPVPAFFGKLANVIERASTLLGDDGAFSPSSIAKATRLRSEAMFLESLGFHREPAMPGDEEKLSKPDNVHYVAATFGFGSTRSLPDWDRELSLQPSPAEFRSYHRDLIAAYRAEAERLERGVRPLDARDTGTRDRWTKLERIARRLEVLAHKQLRQQPWTAEESSFIKNYGEQIADVMGYFGNSWLTPRDDAPRWAEVFRDTPADRSLAVGIGRARLLHVLYPWNGTHYLCQGAVLSYYEESSDDRLTDEEWRDRLDSTQAPPPPPWLQPFLAR